MNSSAKISLPPISDILQQATQPSSPSGLRMPPLSSASMASASLASASSPPPPSPGPSVLPPLHRAMSTPTTSMGMASMASMASAGRPGAGATGAGASAGTGAPTTGAPGSLGAFGLSNYRYDYYKPVSNITPPPLASAGAAAGSGHPHHPHHPHYPPHIATVSAAPSASAPPMMATPPGASAPPSQFVPRKGDDSKLKRKTRNNLPKETTYILLKWLNDHLNHPYPNSFEKNQLMMSTGLNQQQLSNWFINARRRKIKSMKEQKRLNII